MKKICILLLILILPLIKIAHAQSTCCVQTVDFTSSAPDYATVSGSYYPTAYSSSGMPVYFSVSPPNVATISNGVVSFIGPGTVTIMATVDGWEGEDPCGGGGGPLQRAAGVAELITTTCFYNTVSAFQSFNVYSRDQVVSFSSFPNNATYGGSYVPSATSSSGLPVTFSSSTPGVAIVSGGVVSFIGVGLATITASQVGDSRYNPAEVSQNFYVNRADQVINFTSPLPGSATIGSSFLISASSSSGLPVTLLSSTPSVATISGGLVSVVGAGTATITANQGGNGNYNAAAQVQHSFTVNRINQTISFTSSAPVGATFGGSYVPSATSTSGLPVTFSSSTPSVATVSGGTVSFVGAGTAIIIANQSGNGNYNAASPVQQTFPVSAANQTITFSSTPSSPSVGGTYVPTASSSSGLPVTFSSSTAGVAIVSGGIVSFVGAGTAVIVANQAGNVNYNTAQIQQTFTVSKGSQVISITSSVPIGATFGGSYVPSATSSSGLPVTFSSSTPGVATVSGGTVSFVGAGTAIIIADQAGNVNYNAASPVQQTFTVGAANQTITFTSTPPGGATFGGTYVPSATSTSGLPVTFSSSTPTVTTVSGGTVSFVGVGTAIITANQAGNINYNAASPVQQTFTVSAANQTITFNALANRKFGDSSFDPGATSSTGLPVTYVSSNGAVATISGSMINIVGVGSTSITAKQLGNTSYLAASDVTQILTVNPSPLVIASSNSSICLGASSTLTASGAATYSWSPSTGLSASTGVVVTASPRSTTTYTITGTYANGLTTSTTSTVLVSAIPLAAGGSHSIVLRCNSCGGGVTSSGLNTSGQLGDGTFIQKTTPISLGLTGIISVASGTSHSLFLKNDGTAWATGLNTNGQLGDGSTTTRTALVQVSGLTGIIGVSAGNTHSLFLKDDGTVWACGLNSNGQLGDATLVQKNTPVQVTGISGIIRISAGGIHSLFLKNDGTVWACGSNSNGRLGDGTTTRRTSPVLITTLSGIAEISAGGSHSHFLKNNGTVWATGLNTNGQLGDGTTVQKTTPVLISTLTNIIAVSGGANHTLFLKDIGTAWATGLNSNKQLGDGTTVNKNTPIQVSSVTSVIAIDAGATHTLFLQSNGLVFACGRNANGQLGDGTTTARSIPVAVVNSVPCGRVRSDVVQETIEIETNSVSLEAYPNPANGELTLDLPEGALSQISPIVVFDSFGKIAMQDQFNPGEATKTLDTNRLSSGVYLVSVIMQSVRVSKKVVVVH